MRRCAGPGEDWQQTICVGWKGCVLVDGSDMSSEILGRAGDGQTRWRSRDRGAGKTRGAADVMLEIAAP